MYTAIKLMMFSSGLLALLALFSPASHAASAAKLSLTAQFVDFSLGDAEHYMFKDKDDKEWEFNGCQDKKIGFAYELPEKEANSDNQGWGPNKSLVGKWFKLSYQIKKQPRYEGGPPEAVKIITAVSRAR